MKETVHLGSWFQKNPWTTSLIIWLHWWEPGVEQSYSAWSSQEAEGHKASGFFPPLAFAPLVPPAYQILLPTFRSLPFSCCPICQSPQQVLWLTYPEVHLTGLIDSQSNQIDNQDYHHTFPRSSFLWKEVVGYPEGSPRVKLGAFLMWDSTFWSTVV